MDKQEKIKNLQKKLEFYEAQLRREMIGYKGVQHESAASEIKHDKVMVLTAMIEDLKKLIEKLRLEP